MHDVVIEPHEYLVLVTDAALLSGNEVENGIKCQTVVRGGLCDVIRRMGHL